MRRGLLAHVITASALLLLPAAAWAQTGAAGTIAGVVRDASGAVLPGVTVEAASPALIEKVRSAVTDGQGVYRIVELRPGTYTVTFSLPGFSTLRREGIDLTTGFTATVNAELVVGALEETVTVSGAAPVVDTQNVIQRKRFARDVLDALPVGKNAAIYITLIPGATQGSPTQQDVGGNKGENTQQFTIHGTKATDYTRLYDGQWFGTTVAAGNYMNSPNPAGIQEVTVQVSGGITAESEVGGPQVNMVPKDGGNTLHSTFQASFGHENVQARNLDDALRARGLTTAPFIRALYDVGGGVGGPIKRDKLWFYATSRYWITSNYLPGNYYNKLQGTVFYEPDLSRPAYEKSNYLEGSLRLTWQVSPKNKVNATATAERNCNCFFTLPSGTLAPEAAGSSFYMPNWKTVLSWSYPATNRLLFEAGGVVVAGVLNRQLTGGSYSDRAVLDLARNYWYGAAGSAFGSTTSWGESDFGQTNQRFAVSYVTGSHAVKTGFQLLHSWRNNDWWIADNISYVFRGRVPQAVRVWAGPHGNKARQRTLAIFAQDQWTIRRLTLNLGLRFDYYYGWIPDQHLPAGTYVPERRFEAIDDVVNWKDLNPRLGAAYDLFGDGRTAVKVFLGRYIAFEAPTGLVEQNNPLTAMVTGAERPWADANGDYIPQESELGPLSNLAFGTVVRRTFYADDVLRGFGNRQYSWQGAVSMQHELRPGLAVDIGYFRTWHGNFRVTDNQEVTAADYDPYCITAPVDPRLPNGGEQICGLYDVQPARFGRFNNLVTLASNFGKQTEVFNGVDVTVTGRFGSGGQFSGGVSTGRTVTDRCFVVDSPQELYQCRVSPSWSAGTQFKLSGVYPLPWDIQVGATYQNLPGIPTTANYVATTAEIAPSLGRNLAGGVRNATVELIARQSLYREGRITQFNIRLGRVFRVKGGSVEPQLDVHNVFNANPILGMTTRYGPAWQNVTGVLSPRVFKFGVLANF